MNPDQVPQTIITNHHGSKTTKILISILVVVAVAGTAYLLLQLLNTQKELNEYKTTKDSVGQEQSMDYNSYDQRNSKYSISYVEDLEKGKFQMQAFPSVDFSISKIVRVEGLEVAGCSQNFPQEVTNIVRLAGCYSNDPSDPETANKSLVGIDIDVSNNSKSSVTGDIIKILYYESRDGEVVARLASLGAIPFSSYNIEPLSDRNVSLHTWIPADVNRIDLIYGMDDFTPYRSKLSDIENADGRIVVDFDKSAITEKVILKSVISNEEKVPTFSITNNDVISKLSGVRAYAEVYYNQKGSYGVSTDSCTGGMFGDDNIISYTKDLIAKNMVGCRSSGQSYAMYSTLPDTKGLWCIDSYGRSNSISVGLALGDTSCN